MRARIARWMAIPAAGAIALLTLPLAPGGSTAIDARADADLPDALGMRVAALDLQSAGAMTFGPDGTLFLADSRAGRLHAVAVSDSGTNSFSAEQYIVPDIDRKIAAALGTTRDQIRFRDMAVHPRTRNVYFTVARAGDAGADAAAALVRVRGRDAVEVLDLAQVRHSSAAVPAAPSRDAKTPWGQPQWMLSVTDLAFVDGQLWVAGLSNEQFASALRRVPFPFAAPALTTVEIYHTSHDRYETAAPIDAFLPLTLNGEPMILAGYGCSPIATFRRADLIKGGHVRGRTVAELGGGNRPVDMISYMRDGQPRILIANSDRTLMRIDPADIVAAPEMTTPVSQAYEPAGVKYLPVASAGVMQLDDFDGDRVLVLRRDLETGYVHLTALQKKWL
jgi:hypothetical protein